MASLKNFFNVKSDKTRRMKVLMKKLEKKGNDKKIVKYLAEKYVYKPQKMSKDFIKLKCAYDLPFLSFYFHKKEEMNLFAKFLHINKRGEIKDFSIITSMFKKLEKYNERKKVKKEK